MKKEKWKERNKVKLLLNRGTLYATVLISLCNVSLMHEV